MTVRLHVCGSNRTPSSTESLNNVKSYNVFMLTPAAGCCKTLMTVGYFLIWDHGNIKKNARLRLVKYCEHHQW